MQSILNDFQKLKSAVYASRPRGEYKKTHSRQYDPKLHDVHSKIKRPDKTINVEENKTRLEPVNRISLPIQRQIVQRAATFLCGNPVEMETLPIDQLQEVEKNLVDIVKKIAKDNKLQYEDKTICKILFSEKEVAELWFFEDAPKDYWKGTANANVAALDEDGKATKTEAQSRLRMKILANSKGDTLTPIFNGVGDMIAFIREYTTTEDGKDIPHFDVYTDTQTVMWKRTGNTELTWARTEEANVIGKIPIVYYSQDTTEWYYVQEMIDRLEVLLSNLADTNDYNGTPMILVKGTIQGFSAKGERGKVLEMDPDASAEYLTWSSAPESIQMEIETLLAQVYDLTDTPKISFDQLKELGATSGIALRLMFMASHMKASDHEETVGKGMQRRNNLLKKMAATINIALEAGLNVDIRPKFEYFVPKNTEETITLLNSAVNGGIMSQETAVHQNPLIDNPEEEIKKITKEANDAAARQAAITNAGIL